MLLTLKDIYDAEIAKTAVNTTVETLHGIEVDSGYLLTVQLITVENQTNDYTTLDIGLTHGSTFQGLLDQSSPAASGLYYFRWKVLVSQGHKLTAKLYGCTAGDYIRMHLQGYIYYLGD